MKNKGLLIFLMVFVVSSCTGHNNSLETTLEVIDIKSAFDDMIPVGIDDIARDYNYIMLETTDECLIEGNSIVYSDEQNIIVLDRTRILLFDRNSGKFIRSVGNIGNGPGEYSRTYPKMPYNYEKKTVYARNNTERLEYDLEGGFLGSKKPPELVYDFVDLGNETYAAFIDNYMGNEKKKIIVFNDGDSIIKTYPNYLSFEFKGSVNVYSNNSWFNRFNDEVSFCEKFNDTLFYFSPENLEPRYLFYKGQYEFPYELRGGSVDMGDKYFFTENVLESTRYLFYVFGFKNEIYTAVYDKERKEVFVNNYVGESGNGFVDNINGFPPLELSSINDSGELVGVIDAFRINQWFRENGEEAELLPEYIRELERIDEMDNPIVVIAKLRE